MITVKSKIKTIFGKDDKLLRYIGAICDTKRIESNAEKMVTLSNLLYTYKIPFQFLGGATNRLALQIDGYAVKFAMDEQGYLDNLIEYSLSPELQPYVTKSFETNGYILIAECVELMTSEKWELYRTEIRKVLDILCNDYLLGDVGYIKKNMTNWGIRENRPVILDYAYCHRFTENLFTCSRCGSPLTYDSTYDKLMCTDRSGCRAVYTYNDRKRIQGKQVDIDMINERKGESIRLPKGVVSKDIAVIEDRMIGDNAFIIDNPGDYHRYIKMKEEGKFMTLNIEEGEETMNKLDMMIRMLRNPEDTEAKELFYQNLSDEGPEPIYTENYQSRYMFGGPTGDMRVFSETNGCYHEPQKGDYDADDEEEDNDFDPSAGLNNLIAKMINVREQNERDMEDAQKQQEDEYLENLRKRQEAAAGVPITVSIQDDKQTKPIQVVQQKQVISEPEQEPEEISKVEVEVEVEEEEPHEEKYSVATQVDNPEENEPEEPHEELVSEEVEEKEPIVEEPINEEVAESTEEAETVAYTGSESENEEELETIKVNGVDMKYSTVQKIEMG